MSDRPILSVRDARVGFNTARGTVRAVDGVSFDLGAGRTLGIVGESGSGKSVLVRSLIGLVSTTTGVEVEGQVLFEGGDIRKLAPAEFRGLLGRDIGIVFQDPMTSLNPVMKIGDPSSCWRKSASPNRSAGPGSIRTKCRAACASGWRLPSPSPVRPSC